MLQNEKVPGKFVHTKKEYDTWVLKDKMGIIGFFTLKFDRVPLLQHFCVKKDRRGLSRNAVILVDTMKKLLRNLGNKVMILQGREKDERTLRFIEKTFKIMNKEIVAFKYENDVIENVIMYLAEI